MSTLPLAPTYTYTDRQGVEWILGVCGVNAKVNDSGTTVVTTDEENYLTYSIYVASQTIDMYLLNRYSADVLAGSWVIRNWASIIAAYRVSLRRCNAPPTSLQYEYEQTMESLTKISVGQLMIGNLPSLATPGIAMSNLRMDPRFTGRQMRVETPISSTIPTGYRQTKDISTGFIAEQ